MNLKINKGQISIEMIVILAVLIIAAILVGVLVINSSNRSIDSADETNQQIDSTVEGYVETLKAYKEDGSVPTTPPPADTFTATITSPSVNVNFLNTGNIDLDMTSEHGANPITCLWTYSPVGMQINGCSGQVLAASSVGLGLNKTITLNATDAYGNISTDTVNVNIYEEDISGGIIVSPSDGDFICKHNKIVLVSNTADFDPNGLVCVWKIGTTTLPFVDGCANYTTPDMGSVYGNDNTNISLEITNTLGQRGQENIEVVINASNCL
ncbi:MAG: hypothetical protein PHQ07_03790 [Candidatus ainarchaeum sp.]|nr:hypothetical protein [Candidatus ainarchaeum sp.]